MAVINKAIKFIIDPEYRFLVKADMGMYDSMPDEEFIRRKFKAKLGYELNLDNPRTFNEKLQWIKLHDRKPIYTKMVDKYEAKDYVASIIGDEYIIPTIGVWDSFDDIDFDILPNQFVLKCTHDSGGLVICKDKSKLDIAAAKHKINKSLRTNYYYVGREWPYRDVKPRIIAEKYMVDSSTKELRDYKFFCFGGIVKCYKVDFDRFISHKANYFTTDGSIMKMGEEVCPPDFKKTIKTPAKLKKMEELASRLSESQPFLRADFYDVNGQIYFGELTFFPASGFGKFIYEGNDELLGSWINLPDNKWGGYCLIYNDLICVLSPYISKESGEDHVYTSLKDYKIYTFNGEAKLCMINQDRKIHTRADYFDRKYNWLDFMWGYDHADTLPEKPENYELMFELSEKLAINTLELRVDFYEVNGKVFFGELTFFDGGGFDVIEPVEWDYKLGNMLNLMDIKG